MLTFMCQTPNGPECEAHRPLCRWSFEPILTPELFIFFLFLAFSFDPFIPLHPTGARSLGAVPFDFDIGNKGRQGNIASSNILSCTNIRLTLGVGPRLPHGCVE
jgi:hypothetical protein